MVYWIRSRHLPIIVGANVLLVVAPSGILIRLAELANLGHRVVLMTNHCGEWKRPLCGIGQHIGGVDGG